MMFEQCKIVLFNNITFMKKHRKIFRKNSMEIFQNMKFSGQIFRLTSLTNTDIEVVNKLRHSQTSHVILIAYIKYARSINTYKDYKYLEANVCMALFNSIFSDRIHVVRLGWGQVKHL